MGIIYAELIKDELASLDEKNRSYYEDNYEKGLSQNMLDKENIRQWLIEQGFKGDGVPPKLTDDIRVLLSEKYIELYKKLTGKDFIPYKGDVKNRILNNLKKTSIL